MPHLSAALFALTLGLANFSEAQNLQHDSRASTSLSRSTAAVADWVKSSGDNRNLPFLIIDKVSAEVTVFDARGTMRGTDHALLGMARADVAATGIGDRPLATIDPSERVTQAGRFFAQLGPSRTMPEVLWIDYQSGLSLHPVITTNPDEQRPERLASPSPADNRITLGCINVSDEFYATNIRQTLTTREAIIYILPETRALTDYFPAP